MRILIGLAVLLLLWIAAWPAHAGPGCGGYQKTYTPYKTYAHHDEVFVATFFNLLPIPAAVPAGTAALSPGAAGATATTPPLTTPATPSPGLAGGLPEDLPPLLRPAAASAGPAGDAVAVLRTNCASCHGGGKTNGGVTIFNAQGAFAPSVDTTDLYDAVKDGRMPKGRQLSPADRKALLRSLLVAK